MKRFALIALGALAVTPVWAAKSCDELKAELTAKIESHGVKSFSLEVVASDQVADKKVVGSCAGGSKKIVYTRK
jgi:Protein of unknown function (DUF1161)